MKPWTMRYKERLCSADEAVKGISSGDRVILSHAAGEPRTLPGALVRRADSLRNVEVVHMVSMGEALYCRPEYADSFRHVAFFGGPPTREAIWDNRGDYIPINFGSIPYLLETLLPVDVAMVTVSPPDDNGYCSLGISVDYTKKAVETAGTVIAEVNPHMPRTLGNSFVHVDEIDHFVEVDTPVHELKAVELTDVEKNIGRHVVELIEDGCCLQLGIGGIPDAVLMYLTSFKDLGIHSEMVSDGVKHLVEKGVITGRKKSIHKGKIVVSFLMGSRNFYDWVHDNPIIEMHTVDYTNSPYVVAQNKKMVAINSALEVDLLGQVCADTLGPKQFSGVGGQLDFVRGAGMAEGGKAVIALPSVAKGGVSRIVPVLKQGAAVTTSRNDVDYVVTDQGVAALKGRAVRERMRALINVASPAAREELARQAYEIYHVLV